MANYRLNNILMSDKYGFIPGKQENSNIALLGAWDMPARMGKTYHEWGKGKGIEPYVLPSEIRFSGRNVNLTGYIKGINKADAMAKLKLLYSDIDNFTQLVPLSSDKFGVRNVLINGEITATFLFDGFIEISIPFREPVVDLTGVIPSATNQDEYGIDGIGFKDLGLLILSMQSQLNRPAPKNINVTFYNSESYNIGSPASRNITIRALILKNSISDFNTTVKGLYALFSKPGLRYIIKPGDYMREFFVKDGFKITGIYSYPGQVWGVLEITITEIRSTDQYYYLSNSENEFILTGLGNKILIT